MQLSSVALITFCYLYHLPGWNNEVQVTKANFCLSKASLCVLIFTINELLLDGVDGIHNVSLMHMLCLEVLFIRCYLDVDHPRLVRLTLSVRIIQMRDIINEIHPGSLYKWGQLLWQHYETALCCVSTSLLMWVAHSGSSELESDFSKPYHPATSQVPVQCWELI